MNDLKSRLKIYEGTKEYQQKIGCFKNDRFFTYKDSLGKPTIGYGHLLTTSEKYPGGLSIEEAEALLDKDIAIARSQLSRLNVVVPYDWEDFLIIMLFQLGLGGVMRFRGMLSALRANDYKRAVVEARDSLWYRQTPNRVDQMVAILTNK